MGRRPNTAIEPVSKRNFKFSNSHHLSLDKAVVRVQSQVTPCIRPETARLCGVRTQNLKVRSAHPRGDMNATVSSNERRESQDSQKSRQSTGNHANQWNSWERRSPRPRLPDPCERV